MSVATQAVSLCRHTGGERVCRHTGGELVCRQAGGDLVCSRVVGLSLALGCLVLQAAAAPDSRTPPLPAPAAAPDSRTPPLPAPAADFL